MFVRRPPSVAGYAKRGGVIVTVFDAATAKRGIRMNAAVAVIGFFGLGLAGCETAGNLFGGDGSPSAQVTPAPEPAAQQRALASVQLAPLIGAPDQVSKDLVAQLTQAAEKQRLRVVQGSPDYTLRGYIVASRDKAGTKVSYIWDVADQSGKRVNRITGEELAAGTPNSKDPWSSVNSGVTQIIADKSIASLAAWVSGQQQTPVAAASPVTPPTAGAGAGTITPQEQPIARAPAVSNTTTAALPRSDALSASVPTVSGAPGDGNAALATALQRELSRQGVALGDGAGVHKVEGKVVLGAAKDGKQSIQIDWRVKDPQGKPLGTVSQKNEIPPGSLDGEWGKTAEAAAAAAAQGIVKLLPQAKSTN